MEAEIEAESGDALDAYMTDGFLLRGGAIECGVNILICCVHLRDMEKAEVCFNNKRKTSENSSQRGRLGSESCVVFEGRGRAAAAMMGTEAQAEAEEELRRDQSARRLQ
ncbi:hypothetical protein Droror1_Dr00018344 [Drosera rotundifolia]